MSRLTRAVAVSGAAPGDGRTRAIVFAVLPILLVSAAACRASSTGQGPSGAPQPVRPPSATAGASQSPGPNLVTLTFASPSGAKVELHVRIEGTEPLREQGLMNITNLPDDEGDLFTWQDIAPNQDVLSPFWMKDTKIPLSIAFVAADGRIMEVQDMAADTVTYHVPRLPYRFAIEANSGWYDRHGMPAGSVVSLPSPLGAPVVLTPVR
jgi:uncharacterized membrane protein (UPF0127 family)